MNNNLFFLNIGIKNQQDKKSITLKIYLFLGITGALLLFGSKIVFQLQKQQFSYNTINRIANLGTLYIVFQLIGIILIAACLSVIPFFALPGDNYNRIVNIIGWTVKFGLMIAIFWLCLYKYKPMFNYELKKNALVQDINFVRLCRKDVQENSTIQMNDVQVNFELIDNKESVYYEIDSSGYFVFTDGEKNTRAIFSKSDFYKIKRGISGGSNSYNITYYSNSHIIKSWSSNPGSTYKVKTEDLIKELLDQNIELTLEIVEPRESIRGSKVILIKRPHIAYYDDSSWVVPLDRTISLLVKKDGVFYDEWDFYCKKKLNDLWFLAEKGEEGVFEMTLVFGYDEVTGEYTPVSNTIIYTLNGTDDYYHPHFEYESIPLDKSKIENYDEHEKEEKQ